MKHDTRVFGALKLSEMPRMSPKKPNSAIRKVCRARAWEGSLAYA